MKKLAYQCLLVSFLNSCSLANSETSIPNLEGQGFTPEFERTFREVYAKGPNFNSEDFVLTYPCGGGAICGSIYDSSRSEFVAFPDDFIGASEVEKFKLKFSGSSNQICFWGQSAYTSQLYNNTCYDYENGYFNPSKPSTNSNLTEQSDTN
ncbi:hypothetical protein LYZ37_17140 [Vibrio tubiashii]|uniref:hypothetical protein n=1 Tax=Vibrio tubiashii TaxID=29498 RepID=UPI00234F14FD|nr:hypothetical protein [Vibrio tubiashii]WCP69739.1 hypothetical protein LYZ37_17140 [Vibrio tubiashii]